MNTDYRSYLIINKGSGEVYERTELAEVAFIVENGGTAEGKELISELSWSIRRTGRWDRFDRVIVVIPSSPELVEA
jgi:hypothetical protein